MPTVHELLHSIVEKLPVHESEKTELHAQIDDNENPKTETEVTGNGRSN